MDEVREPLSRDEYFDLDLEDSGRPREAQREFAQQLVTWASDPHPDSELSPGRLLTYAGERLSMIGDHDAAEECLDQAVAAADWGEGLDPRCFLISLYLDQDRTDEALDLDGTLRRSRPEDVQTYAFMGDLWWSADDPRRALGWLNRGLDHVERTASSGGGSEVMLCQTRWNIRKAQGHEPDEYDQVATSVAERLSPG